MTAAPLFVGFESIGRQDSVQHSLDKSEQLAAEVSRLLARLKREGGEPSSLLSIDVFAAATMSDYPSLMQALGGLLPADARPVVSLIPTKQLPAGSAIRLQAIALPGQACTTSDDERFPGAANAGSVFAAATIPTGEVDGVVEQSKAGLAWLVERIEELGGSVTDVLRFNIFYVGGGTRDAWAESARIRAAHFPEPGPCATGIPVAGLAQPGAEILFQVNGIVGARGDGRIKSAWPEGHWDWPFHLPYRHGNRAGDVYFVGGQVSLAPDSSVIDPGNLEAQTTTAVRNIASVLADLGGSLNDVVRLTAFYEVRSDGDGDTIRRQVRSAMPEVEFDLSLVGMGTIAYPDMLVEIECQAVGAR